MFRLNDYDGSIHFEDGHVIHAPYDDERYLEYASWVQDGNNPEVFSEIPEEPVPVSVTRFQMRAALDQVGLFDAVEEFINSPETLRVHKFAWVDAQVFSRDSVLVADLTQALALTDKVVDDVFRLAASMTS